jgi:hypothetical protein
LIVESQTMIVALARVPASTTWRRSKCLKLL